MAELMASIFVECRPSPSGLAPPKLIRGILLVLLGEKYKKVNI